MSKQASKFQSSENLLISLVDDDEEFLEAMAGLLRSAGFSVEGFRSAANFLASSHCPATRCLITDLHMPGMDGMSLHRHLVRSGHAIPTVLITAYPEETLRARALADGVLCYLTKPCSEDALLGCVNSALGLANHSAH
jgi:FixJ family two-component response regulator